MDASRLRQAFTDFFVERDHVVVPSSGAIPQHPTAPLLTNAGMNQFVPYILGEEPTPYRRATSVQKCFRTADIDIIGTTSRHVTFFEMLGNFSFGDYFKEKAIPWAWEFVTEVLGLDPDRLWVTVFETDDEAETIWREAVGVPAERVQRLGEADNFWEMQKGSPGPCGPNSEIFVDRGAAYGDPGGPAHGGEDRYIEIWNLVFMQYERRADGSLIDLPDKNIDTGAGTERMLTVLQDVPSVFETDVLGPVLEIGERITGRRYGSDPTTDVSLRIVADHARMATFLVSDGVVPSNEDRGYVTRRVVRRVVRHAYQLGVQRPVMPELVSGVVEVMGRAYPELVANRAVVTEVIAREEERFLQTLRAGSGILDAELGKGAAVIPGDIAFKLHDTFGFPIELTREIAGERGVEVDSEGFDRAMAEQRQRGKAARKEAGDLPLGAAVDRYRQLVHEHGATEFTGYTEYDTKARVLAVLPVESGSGDGRPMVEIFLDRTPFYAEAGGQVGDAGTITAPAGRATVLDTTYALPGLHRHLALVEEGGFDAGQEVLAAVDGARREAIRRNHTGTHLLHWALREVLGPHVKQAGSLVAPDRLRFDFSHYAAVTPAELERVEDLVNERVLANEPVRAYETSRAYAAELGAIAFFGEKYGDTVRVVEAGERSLELCGGTHVGALGMIGPVKVVAEGSIGANMRRIEALTGEGALRRFRHEEAVLQRAAALLRADPDELPDALDRVLQRQRSLEDELKRLRADAARVEASELAATALDGVVIARRDGRSPDELRQLALAVREQPGVRAAFLAGTPDGKRVALIGVARKDAGLAPGEAIGEAARVVGGGGGGKGDVAQAGGRDPSKIDDALAAVRARFRPG